VRQFDTIPNEEMSAEKLAQTGFDTIASVCAFVFKKGGEKELRECLEMTDGGYVLFTREGREQAADELARVDLSKAASIVAEIAATKPSEADFCPYPEGSKLAANWHWSLRRRQERRLRSNTGRFLWGIM
jgi:hypothetical protein